MGSQLPPPRWLHSVGTRLALATAALVLLVAGGVYYALTHFQQRSLLAAKSDAARMMVELFAELTSAPLLFADDEGVRDSANYLRANPEVLEAAVFPRSAAGKWAAPMARLTRDASARPRLEPPARVGALQLFPDALEISHWVREPSGQAIGAVSVRLSLARENRNFALLARRTLQISCAVALGVLLLLLLLARVHIIAPLRSVHVAVRSLSSGGRIPDASVRELSRAGGDEIGDLTRGFVAMADAIARREAAIAEQNRAMREVLDNVGQGFLVLDPAGCIEGQHSAVLEAWFGPVPHGSTLWGYLAAFDTTQAEWLELTWSNLGAPFMPIELCVEQMPKTFASAARQVEIEYRPLRAASGELEKMVVVISDVSALHQREAAEREQRALVAMFGALIRDRAGFVGLCEDTAAWAKQAESGGMDAAALLEQLHTLKGNAWLFQLRELAETCEEIEAECAAEQRGPDANAAARVTQALTRNLTLIRPFLGEGDAQVVPLTGPDFHAIEQALRSGAPHAAVLEQLTRASAEPGRDVFARLLGRLELMARRLGKGALETQLEDGGVRFPRARFAPLWAALVHALRNVADHALEPAWEREQRGKSARAQVRLSAERSSGVVRIRLYDDGRGVNWDAVRAKAEARGLPAGTRAELTAALLHHGFSTLNAPSALSGRGVGLSALAHEVERLGGQLRLSSEPGAGTELTLELPEHLVV